MQPTEETAAVAETTTPTDSPPIRASPSDDSSSTAVLATDSTSTSAPPPLADTPEQFECRICLMSDNPTDLVKPCRCSGSLQYAHMKCLKLWVREQADLHCEICKGEYASTLTEDLQPDLVIGLQTRARRARFRTGNTHVHAQQAAAAVAAAGEEDDEEGADDRPFWEHRKFWVRIFILSLILGTIVGLLLFLGMSAGDSTWAAVLLRILAFALPTFIVIRAVVSCWEISRAGRAANRDFRDGLPV